MSRRSGLQGLSKGSLQVLSGASERKVGQLSEERIRSVGGGVAPVWDCHRTADQLTPPGTTPGLIGIYGSPMECLGLVGVYITKLYMEKPVWV